jgi:hypothetical protein
VTTRERLREVLESSLFESVDTLYKNLAAVGFAEEDVAIIRTVNGDTNVLCEREGKRYFFDIVVKERP